MGQASGVDSLVAGARARLHRLSPEAACCELADGAALIDTRCQDDRRRTGGVPGAIPIPLSVLPWRVDPESPYRDPRVADRSLRIILMCAHGHSSSLAAATLLDLGFERATDVEGGFAAWAEQGLPIEPATSPKHPDRAAAAARRRVRLGQALCGDQP